MVYSAAVALDFFDHPVVYAVQIVEAHDSLADAPLVRDDQNAPEPSAPAGQTVEHARHELELLPVFDVIVRPEAVDDSVPVQKQRVERFVVESSHCQNSLHNSRLARS